VPYGTNISNLTASGVISNLATVNPSFATSKDYSLSVVYTVTAENLSTNIYTITVTELSSLTGISGVLKNENNVFIYPNPAENEVNIDGLSNESEITIFNQVGILTYKLQTNDTYVKISLNNLASGLYFCKISSTKANIIRKLVINK
ncbi:MAG: T9SS C-terminal target domain-containing protein, partial [Cytophagales bacterium]